MDLQTSLLVAALVVTLLGVGGYALLLRERVEGLRDQQLGHEEQQRKLEQQRELLAKRGDRPARDP